MTRLDVLVVGGGIGGLCLAQGLVAAGVRVAVYERDAAPDARLQGYRLNIEPTGSRALHACLPAPLWELLISTAGDPGPGMGVCTERLRELMREDPPDGPVDPAEATYAVSRVTLRRLMLAGLNDVVHFGKEFVSYRRHSDGTVTADFADGSSATCNVLVGADGARSRVRRALLPSAGTLSTPGVGIGGKLPLTDDTMDWLPAELATAKTMVLPWRDFLFTAVFRRRDDPAALAARIGDRAAAAGIDVESVLVDAKDDDYLMWAYVAHHRRLGAPAADGSALQRQLLTRTSRWHPLLRRVIADTPTDTIDRFDFSAAERVRPWQTTNVTVLGDAVHHMPPVGGLGGNAALHDADLLRRTLVDVAHGRTKLVPALRSYEATMLRDGFADVRTTRGYLAMAVNRNPVVRGAGRAFFGLCGAIAPLRHAVFDD